MISTPRTGLPRRSVGVLLILGVLGTGPVGCGGGGSGVATPADPSDDGMLAGAAGPPGEDGPPPGEAGSPPEAPPEDELPPPEILGVDPPDLRIGADRVMQFRVVTNRPDLTYEWDFDWGARPYGPSRLTGTSATAGYSLFVQVNHDGQYTGSVRAFDAHGQSAAAEFVYEVRPAWSVPKMQQVFGNGPAGAPGSVGRIGAVLPSWSWDGEFDYALGETASQTIDYGGGATALHAPGVWPASVEYGASGHYTATITGWLHSLSGDVSMGTTQVHYEVGAMDTGSLYSTGQYAPWYGGPYLARVNERLFLLAETGRATHTLYRAESGLPMGSGDWSEVASWTAPYESRVNGMLTLPDGLVVAVGQVSDYRMAGNDALVRFPLSAAGEAGPVDAHRFDGTPGGPVLALTTVQGRPFVVAGRDYGELNTVANLYWARNAWPAGPQDWERIHLPDEYWSGRVLTEYVGLPHVAAIGDGLLLMTHERSASVPHFPPQSVADWTISEMPGPIGALTEHSGRPVVARWSGGYPQHTLELGHGQTAFPGPSEWSWLALGESAFLWDRELRLSTWDGHLCVQAEISEPWEPQGFWWPDVITVPTVFVANDTGLGESHSWRRLRLVGGSSPATASSLVVGSDRIFAVIAESQSALLSISPPLE